MTARQLRLSATEAASDISIILAATRDSCPAAKEIE